MEGKFGSILEYDEEWEMEKLRKAEYEAGRREGIEIGRREGIEIVKNERIAEIIRNMENHGFSIDEIAKITGKSVEQVKTILKNNEMKSK